MTAAPSPDSDWRNCDEPAGAQKRSRGAPRAGLGCAEPVPAGGQLALQSCEWLPLSGGRARNSWHPRTRGTVGCAL
eukprot:4089873-Alexandrium_andersonii.AAC.1